jgi:hypothetical protein
LRRDAGACGEEEAMPRVRLVKPGEEPEVLKPVYAEMAAARAALAERLGMPGGPLITESWQALAAAPELMPALWEYRKHLLKGGTLSHELKEKIAVPVVAAQGCRL